MNAGVRDAFDRLLQRLAGSEPDHRPESLRFGATLLQPGDARLVRLIPPVSRPAAVLIGLQDGDDPGILLTVRAAHLRQHAGQIAFPGGTIEADDEGPAQAALREAAEEVGLQRHQASVVGFLPDQMVLTGFRITPVIARVASDFVPRPDHMEVQQAFTLPLTALLDPANHHPVRRSIGGVEFDVRDLHYDMHRVWGATAGMLFALYELARA
jgi:8-oxo-dGTP pyrophosphatase MutT (NUDIX family)